MCFSANGEAHSLLYAFFFVFASKNYSSLPLFLFLTITAVVIMVASAAMPSTEETVATTDEPHPLEGFLSSSSGGVAVPPPND